MALLKYNFGGKGKIVKINAEKKISQPVVVSII